MTKTQYVEAAKRLLIASVIGSLLMGIVGLCIPRTYTSSASLLFPGTTGSGTPAKDADSGQSALPPGLPNAAPGSADQPSLPLMQGVLTMPQPGTSPDSAGLILKSRKITTKLVRQFRLDEDWGLPFERALEEFQEKFICNVGTSGSIQIVYTDSSPERARKVVEAAEGLLTESVEQLSLDPAARNLGFMRENLEKAEKDCARAQESLVSFQRDVGGAPPDMQLQSLGTLYSDLHKDLVDAQVESDIARSSARVASRLGEDMIRKAQDPTGSDKSMISVLYASFVDKQAALEVLRRKFTDKRPEVVQAKQAAEVARSKVEEEIQRQLSGIKSGASPFIKESVVAEVTAQVKVSALEHAEKLIKRQLETLPDAQAKYGQLQTNLRDERNRLSLVKSEYVKAQLIAHSRGPQFVVVDPPVTPQKANGYRLIYFFLFGFIGGGSVIALRSAFFWLKQSVKSVTSD